jgi:hypothetical protein
MTKLAIIFCGYIKNWEQSKKSFIDNILNTVYPVIPDIFIHTYDNTYSTTEIYYMTQFTLLSNDIIYPKSVFIEPNDMTECIKDEMSELLHDIDHSIGDETTLYETVKTIKKIYTGYKALEDYEKTNNYNYDIVMFTRFDIEYTSPLCLNNINDNNTLYLYNTESPEPCDEVAIGFKNAISTYVSRYETIFNLEPNIMGSCPVNSSNLLLQYCCIKSNINCTHIANAHIIETTKVQTENIDDTAVIGIDENSHPQQKIIVLEAVKDPIRDLVSEVRSLKLELIEREERHYYLYDQNYKRYREENANLIKNFIDQIQLERTHSQQLIQNLCTTQLTYFTQCLEQINKIHNTQYIELLESVQSVQNTNYAKLVDIILSNQNTNYMEIAEKIRINQVYCSEILEEINIKQVGNFKEIIDIIKSIHEKIRLELSEQTHVGQEYCTELLNKINNTQLANHTNLLEQICTQQKIYNQYCNEISQNKNQNECELFNLLTDNTQQNTCKLCGENSDNLKSHLIDIHRLEVITLILMLNIMKNKNL